MKVGVGVMVWVGLLDMPAKTLTLESYAKLPGSTKQMKARASGALRAEPEYQPSAEAAHYNGGAGIHPGADAPGASSHIETAPLDGEQQVALQPKPNVL